MTPKYIVEDWIELYGTQPAPHTISLSKGHKVITLPIGDNHHATLIIHDEAIEALKE